MAFNINERMITGYADEADHLPPETICDNSDGIRDDLNNDQSGLITQGEAHGTLPFTNTMAVIQNVDVDRLVAVLENAVSAVPDQNGRFAQISGFSFDYNPENAAGDRVMRVRLADGTLIWDTENGAGFSGLFDVATNKLPRQ